MVNEEGPTKTTNKERRRTKRQRENGSQTDMMKRSKMAAPLCGKKRWNKKLDSVLAIVPLVEELREELKMMKEENKSLRTGLKWAEMEALKQNQTNAAGEMSEVTEKVIKANREVDQLLRRNRDQVRSSVEKKQHQIF